MHYIASSPKEEKEGANINERKVILFLNRL